jgi:hypothetical protein
MKVLVKSAWGSDDPTKAVFPFLHANALAEGGHDSQRPWATEYPSMCEVRVRGLGESSRVTWRGRMRPSRTPLFSSGSSNGRTSSSARG